MAFDPEAVAASLQEARAARRVVQAGRDGAGPRSIAEGAAAQRCLAARFGAVPPAGFKIGATAAVMRSYLGIDMPLAGFMPAGGLLASGARIDRAAFLAPGLECELAVRLGRDLPPEPHTAARVAAAIDTLFAAMEIVENRYPDFATLGAPTLVADQMFHAGAVLGEPAPRWRDIDLAALRGGIEIGGALRGTGVGGDLMGHPLHVLAWLAGSEEAAAFGGLRAGQVILLGSVTPPIWLEEAGEAVVRFDGLAPVRLGVA